MSAYIQFFIKINDKFAPIATYSRSTKVYQEFQNYAPWEKVSALNERQLSVISDEIRSEISEYEEAIRNERETIDFLRSCKDIPVEDLMDQYRSATEAIEELNDTIAELQRASSFCSFLMDIVEEAGQEERWSEGNPNDLHADSYLYVGIEVGTPTIEDIES